MTREVDGKLYANAGSVGDPLDGDRRACYVTLQSVDGKVVPHVHRVSYDIEDAIRAMVERHVPWSKEIIAVLKRASLIG